MLLLVLQSKCSDRLTEIVLGTLANLACHKGAAAHLLGVAGMQEAVLECFFASVHPPTLTEVRCGGARRVQTGQCRQRRHLAR